MRCCLEAIIYPDIYFTQYGVILNSHQVKHGHEFCIALRWTQWFSVPLGSEIKLQQWTNDRVTHAGPLLSQKISLCQYCNPSLLASSILRTSDLHRPAQLEGKPVRNKYSPFNPSMAHFVLSPAKSVVFVGVLTCGSYKSGKRIGPKGQRLSVPAASLRYSSQLSEHAPRPQINYLFSFSHTALCE